MNRTVFVGLCALALLLTIVGYVVGSGLEVDDDEGAAPPELSAPAQPPASKSFAPDEEFLGLRNWRIGGEIVTFLPGGKLSYTGGHEGFWTRDGDELSVYLQAVGEGRVVTMRDGKLFAGRAEVPGVPR